MRILWVTNIEINNIAEKYGDKIVVGGWLEQTAGLLVANPNVHLTIASNTKRVYSNKIIDNISFYSFNNSESITKLQNRIEYIIDEVNPDIIHIWGTEYIHTLMFMRTCEKNGLKDHVIISIQGLASVCSIHYFAGLPYNVIHHKTLKEFIRPNIYKAYKIMCKNALLEKEALSKAVYCIGRTDMDYGYVKQINKNIKYFAINEILRKPFYESNSWSYDHCEKRTIFFSQTNIPLKGFHNMIMALAIIKSHFPDVKLKVLGTNPFNKTFIEWTKINSYERYIKQLIYKLNLKDNIIWLGKLDAEQMVKQYQNCNVFVCASSIENSSNSVAEAMIIGAPVIASDVGGIKSFISHESEGLLFHDSAYYMLAYAVCQIFTDKELAIRLGKTAREKALITHNRESNMSKLMNAYQVLYKNTIT